MRLTGACSVWRFRTAGDGLSCFTTRARGEALALCPACYRFAQDNRTVISSLEKPQHLRRIR